MKPFLFLLLAITIVSCNGSKAYSKKAAKLAAAGIHKDAVEITWPHEMKAICKKHNIKLVEVNLKNITTNDKVYIILAHNKEKFFRIPQNLFEPLSNYH